MIMSSSRIGLLLLCCFLFVASASVCALNARFVPQKYLLAAAGHVKPNVMRIMKQHARLHHLGDDAAQQQLVARRRSQSMNPTLIQEAQRRRRKFLLLSSKQKQATKELLNKSVNQVLRQAKWLTKKLNKAVAAKKQQLQQPENEKLSDSNRLFADRILPFEPRQVEQEEVESRSDQRILSDNIDWVDNGEDQDSSVLSMNDAPITTKADQEDAQSDSDLLIMTNGCSMCKIKCNADASVGRCLSACAASAACKFQDNVAF